MVLGADAALSIVHMTVISGAERRRRWSAAGREEIMLASFGPGVGVTYRKILAKIVCNTQMSKELHAHICGIFSIGIVFVFIREI